VFELDGYEEETQNAREPKDKLLRGTSSRWPEGEHVNLIDL